MAEHNDNEIAHDDAAIVERVVRNAFKFIPVGDPRWVGVQVATMHGSSVSRALCVRFGLDPDERKPSRRRKVPR